MGLLMYLNCTPLNNGEYRFDTVVPAGDLRAPMRNLGSTWAYYMRRDLSNRAHSKVDTVRPTGYKYAVTVCYMGGLSFTRQRETCRVLRSPRRTRQRDPSSSARRGTRRSRGSSAWRASLHRRPPYGCQSSTRRARLWNRTPCEWYDLSISSQRPSLIDTYISLRTSYSCTFPPFFSMSFLTTKLPIASLA